MKKLTFLLGFVSALVFNYSYKVYYTLHFNYLYQETIRIENEHKGEFPNLSSRFEYIHEHMSYLEETAETLLEEGGAECFGQA